MTDIEQNLFAEFWRKLCEATDIGVAKSNAEYITGDFYHELQHNNAVFAAFKTHRMGNDMAKLLQDSNGNLKPFEQWVNDVQPIANHQVYNWFKTEYNTAIHRAHLATDWLQFEAEKDVLPNLEWMESTSVERRLSHVPYYGLILPIDHEFWKHIKPGDEWGCKCYLAATDEEPTPEEQVPAFGDHKPTKGLENNPADDAKVFSESHPYFPSSCKGCKFNTEGAAPMAMFFGQKKKNCYECGKVVNLTFEAIKKAAKANIDKLKNEIDMYNGYNIPKADSPRGNVIFLRGSFKRIIEHGGNTKEIQGLLARLKFEDVNKWRYVGSAPHAKPHPESENVHYYECDFNGNTYYIITLAHKRYDGDVVHSIKLKEPLDTTK